MQLLKYFPFKRRHESGSQTAPEQASTSGTSQNQSQAEDREKTPAKVVYIDEANTWIINEGLLRDEGVLFGLSGVDAKEKLATITNYYEQRKVSYLIAQEDAANRCKEIAKQLESLSKEKSDHEKAIALVSTTKPEVPGSLVFRYLLGLILVGIAALGCFYLIHFYITPIHGVLATLGIFFFGLFAQFAPISAMLHDEEPSAFKRVKEAILEIGPAVAATILTAYLIFFQTRDLGLSFVIGFFLLFLFFFNGKLILAMAHKSLKELEQFKVFWKEKRSLKVRTKQLEIEGSAIATKEQELAKQMLAHQTAQSEAKIESDKLDEECKSRISLFLSEYHLARQFKTAKSN